MVKVKFKRKRYEKFNYKTVLENIFEKASEKEKMQINTLLTYINGQGSLDSYQERMADKIIIKYRPEFYK